MVPRKMSALFPRRRPRFLLVTRVSCSSRRIHLHPSHRTKVVLSTIQLLPPWNVLYLNLRWLLQQILGHLLTLATALHQYRQRLALMFSLQILQWDLLVPRTGNIWDQHQDTLTTQKPSRPRKQHLYLRPNRPKVMRHLCIAPRQALTSQLLPRLKASHLHCRSRIPMIRSECRSYLLSRRSAQALRRSYHVHLVHPGSILQKRRRALLLGPPKGSMESLRPGLDQYLRMQGNPRTAAIKLQFPGQQIKPYNASPVQLTSRHQGREAQPPQRRDSNCLPLAVPRKMQREVPLV